MSSAVQIVRDDGLGPDALMLIGESEAELASIYPPEVRYAFSPDQLRGSDTRFVVAYLDGAPVACGGMAPLDGYGELKRIFVLSSHRGQGLAETVIAALEEIARTDNLPCMRLETGEASPAAIRLYGRLGYSRCGPFGYYVDNGSSVYMEKALTGDSA